MTRSLRTLTLLACAAFAACDNNHRAAGAAIDQGIEFQAVDGVLGGAGEVDDLRVACADGLQVAVWADDGDIFVVRSVDGGLTWTDPTQIDTGPEAADGQDPRICISGERVYAVWMDDRTGDPDPYVNFSVDGGVTWQAEEIRVGFSGESSPRDPQICCDGLHVYVVWSDERGVEEDIYFNRSVDGGTTWLPQEIQVERDPVGAHDSEEPQIACDGATVWVVWEDIRVGPGEDVYFNRSTDAGDTWLPQDIRLDVGDAAHADAEEPQLCRSGDRLYVTWTEARDGENEDVFFNASADRGDTWLPTDLRLDTDAPGAAQSENARICCDGANVYVVWEDERDAQPGPGENLFLNASRDGGLTFLGADVRIDAGPEADGASIACEGTRVYLAWEDERNRPEGEVFFRMSVDGGRTFVGAELPVSAGASGADPSDIGVCLTPTDVHVFWHNGGTVFTNRSAR